MKKKFFVCLKFCAKQRTKLILGFLFIAFTFFHFYQLPERALLGWDQIDSAWAVKSIIVDHQLLLEGVPVKGNTGIFMGPLYYYLIAPFYFFTNLDPIASPIFAGVISFFNFFVLFYVTKKLFNPNIALLALFINTFSLTIIGAERTQNAIALIVPVSYLIFYLLYKLITGEAKYLPWLAAAVGFAFHVDFTSVFYPIIILLCLPFFPRKKQTLVYSLYALPILLLFFLPTIITEFAKTHGNSLNLVKLFNTTFHGFHLRRVLQLVHDAFIQFVIIFKYKVFDYFDFLLPPLFAAVYYLQKPKKERLLFAYLLLLWIVVPWFVLATYSGELTDSYFSLPRNIFIAILAYFTWLLFRQRWLLLKLAVVILWAAYAIINTQIFIKLQPGNFLEVEQGVKAIIAKKGVVEFKDRDPYSYVYYVYLRKQKCNNCQL